MHIVKGAREEEEESDRGRAGQCKVFVVKWRKDAKCSLHVQRTKLTPKRGSGAKERRQSPCTDKFLLCRVLGALAACIQQGGETKTSL